MKYLHLWSLLLAGGLVGCEQHPGPGQPAHLAPPAAAPAATGPAEAGNPGLDGGLVRDSLYFGRYLTAHGSEGERVVYYRLHPDSTWRKIAGNFSGEDFGLDTANVDRTGEPELLLTEPYRRRGNPDAGDVRTLYVLRVGARLDTLFRSLVYCSDYHHSGGSGGDVGEYYSFEKTQRLTAGYGFVQVGLVRATCEQQHVARPVCCRCDAADLAEAGNPRFARPGRYRWRQGRLRRVAAR